MSELLKIDFGSVDTVIALLMTYANQYVPARATPEEKAESLARIYAKYLSMLAEHESKHIPNKSGKCVFCASLEIHAILNRTAESTSEKV